MGHPLSRRGKRNDTILSERGRRATSSSEEAPVDPRLIEDPVGCAEALNIEFNETLKQCRRETAHMSCPGTWPS